MTSPGIYHLFVYGSLRSHFRSAAYEYIARYFDLAGDATVQGKIFDMGEYPGAIPGDDDSVIVGELYQIKNEREFAWAICQLDDYEGVHVEAHESPLYRREIVQVSSGSSSIPAWIYWFNGDVTGKPLVASGDMVNYQQAKQTAG
ncbi:MAG: gamma-glutamylcyclotransferase family protein [Chitinophagaceae bacterium]